MHVNECKDTKNKENSIVERTPTPQKDYLYNSISSPLH